MKSVPKTVIVIALIGLFMLLMGDYGVRLIGFALFLGSILWGASVWQRSGETKSKKAKPDAVDFSSLLEPLKYKSIYKNTAIGIDTDAKIVHLYQNKEYRAYAFSDVRSWSANIQTGGKFVGGGGNLGNALAMTAANVRASKENAANTGFFVEVKDIDFPKWKIEFPEKGLQQSHDRWMEIFGQHLNES